MDIGRIFGNLPQWLRALDADQVSLLDRLMAAMDTGGFRGIPIGEMARIQEHLLRAGEDAGRQHDMKCAAARLVPVVSGIAFI